MTEVYSDKQISAEDAMEYAAAFKTKVADIIKSLQKNVRGEGASLT